MRAYLCFLSLLVWSEADAVEERERTRIDVEEYSDLFLSVGDLSGRNKDEQLTNLCSDSRTPCDALPLSCFSCEFEESCSYGGPLNYTCHIQPRLQLDQSRPERFCGDRVGVAEGACRYCWSLDRLNLTCTDPQPSKSSADKLDVTELLWCEPLEGVMCLGRRGFLRRRWEAERVKGRHSWPTAFLLSLTLGGFGVDRFYLGLWQSGLGKLFSFGGLGVWTLLDVVLVATGYLAPPDGYA